MNSWIFVYSISNNYQNNKNIAYILLNLVFRQWNSDKIEYKKTNKNIFF